MFKSWKKIRLVRYDRYSNRRMSILLLPTYAIFFNFKKAGSIAIKNIYILAWVGGSKMFKSWK